MPFNDLEVRRMGKTLVRRHWLAIVVVAALPSVASWPAAAEMSLADAYKVIASKKLVDLTHAFSPTTPVWSGFGQATMSAASDPVDAHALHGRDGGLPGDILLDGRAVRDTCRSPAHFDLNGITMDKIPLEQMILPLVVLDDTPYLAADPNHAFGVADLQAWEKEHGQVPKGAFAALRTDMYKDWDTDPERFKRSPFPAWSFETIKYLFEQRGVTAIGHEALDTDTTEKMDSETWLLRNGHYQIEVMANLDQVPATGAVIVVTWPKVENGFGFPARAFAILP